MIIFSSGNLLEDQSEAYVNTVNTVGVMGKGIALQFKQAFPDVFKQYAKDCKLGHVKVGSMHVVHVEGLTNPKYVINFPTKKHWRDPSKMEYIQTGLEDLVDVIKKLGIHSIAIPPLGVVMEVSTGILFYLKLKRLLEMCQWMFICMRLQVRLNLIK